MKPLDICPRCEGTGRYRRLGFPEKPCAVCDGSGRFGAEQGSRCELCGHRCPAAGLAVELADPETGDCFRACRGRRACDSRLLAERAADDAALGRPERWCDDSEVPF